MGLVSNNKKPGEIFVIKKKLTYWKSNLSDKNILDYWERINFVYGKLVEQMSLKSSKHKF